jgi:hypothetical protein
MKSTIKTILVLTFGAFLIGCRSDYTDTPPTFPPLSSWNEGTSKEQIIAFVQEVTDQTSSSFVEPDDRIAVFDNDGTLWSEQPYYFQLQFAIDRIQLLAESHPEWQDDETLSAAINGDIQKVLEAGKEGLLKLVLASHGNTTTIQFQESVRQWIDTTRHPGTGKLYKEMVYQPMLELIEYLHENEFKVFIVSGGGIEFMRPWTNEVYGIPSERVVGSSVKLRFELTEDGPVIRRLPQIDFIDDKEYKPIAVQKHIGKRPIAAFGNSDGDLAMLQWTAAGPGKRLMTYIHHTDSVREWSYDRSSHVGRLDKGLDVARDQGWTIVDMQNDWKTVFTD